jgi:hypothetical protein
MNDEEKTRDMTPDERESFEERELHHEEDEQDRGGPASEGQITPSQPVPDPAGPLSNPD